MPTAVIDHTTENNDNLLVPCSLLESHSDTQVFCAEMSDDDISFTANSASGQPSTESQKTSFNQRQNNGDLKTVTTPVTLLCRLN